MIIIKPIFSIIVSNEIYEADYKYAPSIKKSKTKKTNVSFELRLNQFYD